MHSHTLSRSSSHNYGQARDFDPILRNLSPTTTLRAFSEGDRRSSRDTLYYALQSSTSAQRTLGTRAARTCLDIRSWARELEDWEWPGTFETPQSARNTEELNKTIKESAVSNTGVIDQDVRTTVYWGSLPAVVVQEYEQRTDEIIQQLDEINVEELKEFVLSAHDQAGISSASIDDSIGDIGAATDLRRLDDYTAVITATILQALPYLSRLNRLLNTWSIRLTVLRQTPSFEKSLSQARTDLDRCWAAIQVAQSDDVESLSPDSFNRGTLIEMRSVIEHNVGSLGRKLDGFLDNLEGRSETVPESWIDGMETLESQYAVWLVQAERKILENDLRKRWSRALPPTAAQGGAYRYSSESARLGEAGRGGGLMAPPILSPTRRVYSGESSPTNMPPESVIDSTASSNDLVTAPFRDQPRNDSHTIPAEQASTIADMGSTRSSTTSRSSRTMRHVPILLPYDGGDGQDYPTEGITGDLVSRAGTPASETIPTPVVSPSEVPTSSFAKKRALFAGDIERTQSLQRATKTPVRSFEHASNAFARLFKTETLSPERSSSLKSEISHKRNGSGKTDHGIIWGGRSPETPRRVLRKKSIDSSMYDLKQENNVPVAADAPPVPVLPPMGPSKSIRSLKKQRQQQQLMPSPTLPEPSNAVDSPSGLDFAQSWPLPSRESTNERGASIDAQITRMQAQTHDGTEGTGLSSPKKPLQSDFFHQMFVDSLPGTADERAEPSDLQHSTSLDPVSAISDQNRALSPYPGIVVPTINLFTRDSSPPPSQKVQYSPTTASLSTPPTAHRPSHGDMSSVSSPPLPVTKADRDTSPDSIASATYSPEIQDARASYFQTASPSLSRKNSVANTSPAYTRPLSTQISSPMKLRNPAPVDELTEEDGSDDATLTHRASGISLESQPRLEVKSIDLSRLRSGSSVADSTTQPEEGNSSSPVNDKDVAAFPTPPTIHEECSRSPASPMLGSPNLPLLRRKSSSPSMVTDQAGSAPDEAGLNAFMGKRRGLGIQSNGSPSIIARPKSRQETDTFDRHVSEILQKLPSSIRFRTGTTTPRPRTAEPRTFSGPRPKMNPRVFSSTHTSPGGLTLAPADPSLSKKSSHASDPEVKLYHLTQAGREEPIKLFVRLVGEGERVMVRVGGGWADLADYLRQYAEHHGSRTVSGEVDVKAMGTPAPGSGNVNLQNAIRRKASGPLSADVGRVRAHSPMPATPPIDRSEESETPDPPPATTPSRSPLLSRSRPSTADSSSRPSSKHSWSEMSMAGPGSNGKRVPELPDKNDKKARWVEGMVEMVQKASAEKSKKGEQKPKPFGELGKVGATRRVVFRNASTGLPGAGNGNGDAGRG
jgi:hypothetical protein